MDERTAITAVARTVTIAVVALLVTLLSLVGIAGGTSSSCAGCHDGHSREWSTSSHSAVECHLCHQRPGVDGVVEQRIRMLAMVGSFVTKAGGDRTVVRDSHCLTCHPEVLDRVVTNDGIRVRHDDFLSQGRRCAQCHGGDIHGGALAIPRQALMDECMACHVQSASRGGCAICHLSGEKPAQRAVDSPWQIAHGVTWRYTHGLGDRNTCRACHPVGYCVRCHGIDLPHPDSWTNTHGREARALPQSCGPCHEGSLCTGCHDTDMPHEDGFLPVHSKQAAGEGRAACLGCHIESSCDACHVAHVHPGLTDRQLRLLRAEYER